MHSIKEWRIRDTYGDYIAVSGNKIAKTVTVSLTGAMMLFERRSDIDRFIEKLMKARERAYGN